MRLIITDKRKPRSRIDNLIPVVVGFFLALISTGLLPWIYQMTFTQPDFIIKLDEPAGAAVTYEPIQATINVSDDYDMYHLFNNYKGKIAIVAYEMGGKTLPKNLEVDFEPQQFNMNESRLISSKMTITADRNASIGHSLIEICALGGDSKKRCCLYDFELISRQKDISWMEEEIRV